MVNNKDKFIKISMIVYLLFCVFFNYTIVKAVTGDCGIISDGLAELLNYVFAAIRIATPILVVLLVTIDFSKAVMSGDEKEMQKAQSNAIKRIILGVVIFFIPTIVNIIFNIAGNIFGTCGIG